MDLDLLPELQICSKSKCKNVLPHDSTWKTCDRCREYDKINAAARRKRKREAQPEEPRPAPKHLVQSVHPVAPTFFLEVQRNRTIPFWIHPLLVPLDSCPPPPATAVMPVPVPLEPVNEGEMESGDEVGDGVEDDLVDTFCQQLNTRTFQERMLTHVKNIRDFCDGLEYQIQFNDYRMLTVLERNGSSFLRLADNCLSRERRENSSRSRSPTTWEKGTASAMFYRARSSSQ
ncbi:hypothetical protein EV424DRAFT_1437983 [Suillus variegatus]|nr:hypothetical protein EV424DRAFT_1437983 [Suillus variegatus]